VIDAMNLPWTLPGAIGAELSDDRTYRYGLWRMWDTTKPKALYVMLNPSTADERVNDPTIVRCCERARRLGMGGILVANIFAYRTPDPRDLYDSAEAGIDIVGPMNDVWIELMAKHAALRVCGWGLHGSYLGRGAQVRDALGHLGPLHHLGLSKGGKPKHPLYIGYAVQPQEWSWSR